MAFSPNKDRTSIKARFFGPSFSRRVLCTCVSSCKRTSLYIWHWEQQADVAKHTLRRPSRGPALQNASCRIWIANTVVHAFESLQTLSVTHCGSISDPLQKNVTSYVIPFASRKIRCYSPCTNSMQSPPNTVELSSELRSSYLHYDRKVTKRRKHPEQTIS